MLADDLAFGVGPLGDDHIHVDGPVHGRTAVGLGHHQEVRAGDESANRRRKRRLVAEFVEDQKAGLAQQAEARSREHRRNRFGTVAIAGDEVISAVAQQGEVVLVDPAKKIPVLADLVGGQTPRRVVEIGDDGLEHIAHGLPVLDGSTDVGQNPRDGLGEFAGDLLGLANDFEVHHRLRSDHAGRVFIAATIGEAEKHAAVIATDADDGVDDELNGKIAPAQLRRNRVRRGTACRR